MTCYIFKHWPYGSVLIWCLWIEVGTVGDWLSLSVLEPAIQWDLSRSWVASQQVLKQEYQLFAKKGSWMDYVGMSEETLGLLGQGGTVVKDEEHYDEELLPLPGCSTHVLGCLAAFFGGYFRHVDLVWFGEKLARS